VIVEIKAVQALDALHEAQVLSYLKLSGHPVALLLNFNVTLLSRGVRRLINGTDRNEPQGT
jgi:GxxExxY protein